MVHEYKHARRVEFADTDMAGIAHFSAYFRYVEEAEHALYRSLGLSVHTPGKEFSIGFPRLSATCEFLKALRFEEVVEIHLSVKRKGTKSITYRFTMSRAGSKAGGEGEAVAKGELAVACCRCYPDGRIEAIPLPPPFDRAIEEPPREA
jgi:YbgC/YbaW family acyl-CoA thioester hydrolase